jgi:glycosyltransferase involved in cell wall biosynthesis
MPIRLSVAVVTRNRPASLRRCLESLRAQAPDLAEIVISDDSDAPEETRGVAEEFGARYLTGPRRGLYANRNAAALACTGTHIRTMDDDHIFPPGHFAQCLAAAERDPESLWTCGERSFIDGEPYESTALATQLHPAGVAGPITDPDDNWGIADGSTIFPRTVFDRGFRYFEEIPFGSIYLEFGALLYARGWRSRCIPGAFVDHYANRATLDRSEPRSVLFASLCYNLKFRPSAWRAVRFAARYAGYAREIPALLRKIERRWQT